MKYLKTIRRELHEKLIIQRLIMNVVEFVFPFLLIGLIIEVVFRAGFINNKVLPPPSALLLSLCQLALNKDILSMHLMSSMVRFIFGYSFAIICGVTVGALIAMNRTIREIVSPLINLLVSVPTIAWVPVLLITMGLGDRTVVTAIFLGGFFVITYSTIRGIEMVNTDTILAARTMGVSGFKLFLMVLLPGSLVSLITGLRLGIGYAWRALVGAEMLSALIEWGLGKMIYEARFWNDVSVMIIGLMLIGLIGALLDQTILKWLERETVEKWGMLVTR